MGLIQSIANKISGEKGDFKRRFKEAQENQKIEKLLEQRNKSSDERELESHLKRMREDDIKSKLEKIHNQQNKDNWKSNSILSQKATMLKNDKPILKEKNIFKNEKNLFIDNKNKIPIQKERKGMFFRW
jgi:hypothetical protein